MMFNEDYKSAEYYVVLGSDVMSRILRGKAVGKPGSLYVQDTLFGYTYFGEGITDTAAIND